MLATDNNYRKPDSLNELKRVPPRNAGISSCHKPGRQERNRISRACDFCRIKKAKVGEDFSLLSSIGQRLTYGDLPNSAMVENPVASAREVKLVALTSMCGNPRALRQRQPRQQSILVECIHILHRRLQAEQDPEDSNVSSPGNDISVKDIVESLGLAPVDIVEPRAEFRTHKPPPEIANSPMDDGSSASARHRHIATTQSSSTKEESQFLEGIDFEEYDHLDSSSPSCNTSPDPLNDWDLEETYDPMRFASDYSVICDGRPSWSYSWFHGEVY
ncbi:hypothetical protein LTR72_000855 [Exophiala xenobiotica]|nr:hypothetical protein LTR72_000855 [Exophiala xenobiotica]KAK5288324.1 hypothetical protein LTR14_008182 [Exophiala xenobiotica]KAK5314192.1 hypothetical protein LTR93_010471 [Exophiala xenobiotica]KAK5411378.1 hypothetical protein LTR06_006271 [Exophiala xenobiotica]